MFFRALLLVLILFAGACGPRPTGPVNEPTPDRSDLVGNGGCLIVTDEMMLTVRHRVTGKLDTPGGTRESGESAQATAHRETWEEAGLQVDVGDLLFYVPETDFYLFACKPVNDSVSPFDPVPVTRMPSEISEVLWVDPDTLDVEQWRYAPAFAEIKEAALSQR